MPLPFSIRSRLCSVFFPYARLPLCDHCAETALSPFDGIVPPPCPRDTGEHPSNPLAADRKEVVTTYEGCTELASAPAWYSANRQVEENLATVRAPGVVGHGEGRCPFTKAGVAFASRWGQVVGVQSST